jgi:opacity protein-like surface antigen
MNKFNLLLVVLLALFIALPAGAQHRIGFVGGLNLANVSLDPDPDPGFDLKNRTAFGAGGVLDLRLAENVALRFEPMYLQKGTKVEGNVDAVGKVEQTVKANYLEMPVLVKLALGTSTTKPYLMAGPTIGFLLSAKTITKAAGQEEEEDIKEFVKDIDFGLDFGAGVSFPAGNNAIFVEGRYALGLTNVNDDPDDPDTKIKTKGIQFMAGISFPLGGK